VNVSALGSRSIVPIGMLVVSLVYLNNTLPLLTMLPRINVDEPWLIERAYQILVSGRPRQPMFLLDRAYLLQPGYSLLLAPWLKLVGVGLLQARLLAVIFGFATLWCVYRCGFDLFGVEAGLFAVTLLATDSNFLGVSRFARTDGPAVLFAALALMLFLRARATGRRSALGGSGAAAGVAMLCHANAYWVVIVLAAWHLVAYGRRFLGPAIASSLGFAATFGPYLALVVIRRDELNAQLQMFAIERVPSLTPSIILQHVLHESERYRDWYFGLVTDFTFNPLLRIFQICAAVGIVWLVAAIVNGWRMGERREAEELVASAVLISAAIFAAFIPNKALVYMPHLLIGFSLAGAYGVWRTLLAARARMRSAEDAAAPMIACIALVGGGAAVFYDAWYLRMTRSELRPYADTDRALRALVPSEPKYLFASPTFWLPFHDDPQTRFVAYTGAGPYRSVTPEGFFTRRSLYDLPQDRPYYVLVDDNEWKTILSDPSYRADWRAAWIEYISGSCALKGVAVATAHGNIALYRCWNDGVRHPLDVEYVVDGRVYRRGEIAWRGAADDLASWRRYRPTTSVDRDDAVVRVSGNGAGIFRDVPVRADAPYLIDVDVEGTRAGDALSIHGVTARGGLRFLQWKPLTATSWFPDVTIVKPTVPTLRLYLYSESATDFRVRAVTLYSLVEDEASAAR
jgi:4-amino-4-deoxy-L-arabinose transferase-like glycosyltransferase